MSGFDRDGARAALMQDINERESAIDAVLASYARVHELANEYQAALEEHNKARAAATRLGFSDAKFRKAGIRTLSAEPAKKRDSRGTRKSSASTKAEPVVA